MVLTQSTGAQGWLKSPLKLKNKRIWVAGHTGLVGSALANRLQKESCEILTATKSELDLRNYNATEAWMDEHAPDMIILAAAKVGGIHANKTYPADFIADNLMIQNNVISLAFKKKIQKLLFLGSSCIYPKNASIPLTEDSLMSGKLEPTNKFYAIAKIAGVKLCESYRKQYGCDFISAMPCNIYGAQDFRLERFNIDNAHVIAALIAKAHHAKMDNNKTLTVWGTGKPKREFMHSDDLADALIFILKNYSHDTPINVGSESEISIAALAELICQKIGFSGSLKFDTSMPDGVFSKRMNSTKLHQKGWKPRITLDKGIAQAYDGFRKYQQKQP